MNASSFGARNDAAPRRILAIDGGGLRGVIPASLLVALEAQTGRPAREHFSFLAGTSTGAIIVAALAAGVSAAEVLDFYQTDARTVFARSPINLLRRALFGQMYSTQTLRAAIEARLPAAARGWLLNDVPNDILLTATRLSDGEPWFFVKDQPTNSRRAGAFPLLDCVVASAAAPTYFDPWPMPQPRLGGSDSGIGRPRSAGNLLVDGGVTVAGNPIYMACVEAFAYSPRYAPADTIAVSLGTGRYVDRTRPTHIRSWLRWVLTALLRSSGEQQTEITFRHFGPQGLRLYRIDAKLRRDISLDDVARIPELLRIGAALAATVDWPAILAGAPTTQSVDGTNTNFDQYATTV